MAVFDQIRLLYLKKDLICTRWYWNGENLPDKKEKGYAGFGKSEAVVGRCFWI